MLKVTNLIGFGRAKQDAAPVGGGSNDPNFANVVMLLGFEGADGATTATDDSISAHTLTFNGNAQIDTGQFKYGTASLLCDGTADFVSAPDSADWDLSDANSDPFTIECWIRRATLSLDRTIISQSAAGQVAFSLRHPNVLNTTEIVFNLSNTGAANDVVVTTSGAALTAGNWHHVAVDKDSSGKIRVYANGVMRGSATPGNSAMFNSTAILTIGADSTGARSLDGRIDEVRITKGVARYASDSGYTVPTAAFPRS
ncbi:LamG domain-containing protein [Mesorhizobium sp.]|uniref:LamG domain-containing protein n=1 Tax=Mesorhizobium sp. TaxID=1871066 RepID=UPI000FE51265|nr:LamG domain-containing protein [Mesorhizobium sp.]RWO20649.1 MAG: LamG domain-containing protein [Mesorhizobium sp.]